jgi:acyl-CoA synthetase (AMP-forming)/AMP-acid ligase II
MTPTSSLGSRAALDAALEPDTIGDALERAARDSSRRGIALLDRRGRLAERRTYDIFRDSVETAARRFTAVGLEPGERVVVCLPTSWAFLEAWLGTHLAGGLPVAMAPPSVMGAAAHQTRRVLDVTRSLDARYLVCLDALARDLSPPLAQENRSTEVLTPDRLEATAPGPRPERRSDPDEVAFLQLTSGSTGVPRAVQITHRALLHNCVASSEAIGRSRGGLCQLWAESLVSWLPLYHDMGLVGAIFSLVNGLELTLMSPRTFLGRPHTWLEATARAGRALSPAPNFAFQLAVERTRPHELRGLDLSGWGSAMIGSEMVRPDTMTQFCDAFAPFGFAAAALQPCYGMAEATLSISFDSRGEGVRTHRTPAEVAPGLGMQEVVCVGEAVLDTEVEICAPDGRRLAAETVGEVRVKGPGVFAGYWRDDDATTEVLRNGWLYTGDLGFLDRNGELYLTGRRKEILILHGQNVMPHDLEWIAEGVSGGGGTLRSAAFSVAHGSEGEHAVLVVEAERADADVLRRLRHDVASAIGRTLQIPLADVVLVRRGTIPKTSSGKVQRGELRERYLRGELEPLETERT